MVVMTKIYAQHPLYQAHELTARPPQSQGHCYYYLFLNGEAKASQSFSIRPEVTQLVSEGLATHSQPFLSLV